MTYTLDTSDSVVFTELRAFIQNIIGVGVEVIQVPINRVPSPSPVPFVAMSRVSREQLSWVYNTISNPATQPQTQSTTMPTMYKIQLDIYGPTAGDLAQMIHTVMQAQDAFDFFNGQATPGVYPLYSEDPHQMPLVTGEDQYELRWSMVLCIQYNPSLAAQIQTASTVSASVISVEATYL